jgi:hypothetical protein
MQLPLHFSPILWGTIAKADRRSRVSNAIGGFTASPRLLKPNTKCIEFQSVRVFIFSSQAILKKPFRITFSINL